MAWLALLAAGALEVVWALALKQNDGWHKLGPSVLGVTSAVASFLLLSRALRTLPVGTAYVVWVGIGAFGVALAGMVALGESASPGRLLFLGLIVVGVIGLKLTA
jgi:quaternary ammonium compound-resistance protein SugE